MIAVAKGSEIDTRLSARRWLFSVFILVAGLFMASAQAAPTFDPNAPEVELAPGASLPIRIAPGSSSPTTGFTESLVGAEWTEGGGTVERSKELIATGDTVDYQVPADIPHCTRFSDVLAVDWQTCGDGCFDGNPVSTDISVTVIDPLMANPASGTLRGAPGSVQTLSLALSGGRTPYQAPTSASNADVSFSNGTLTYRIPADATGDYTDTVTINGASAGDECGANSVSVTISISVPSETLLISPSSANRGEVQPGATVEARFAVSGGIPAYTAEVVSGPAGARLSGPSVSDGALTFSYSVPLDAPSGANTFTIRVLDSGAGAAQQSATATVSFTVAAAAGSTLSANPTDISLSAISLVDLDNEVGETFEVSGGVPPYLLSVAGISGGIVGRVEPSQLAAPGRVAYAVDIPANAQSDLAFENRIQITDSTGASVSVSVQANVNASNTLSSQSGLTPNQRSVAQAIETVCPKLATLSQRSAEQEDLFNQCSNMLANPRAEGIPNTLDQITSEKANAAKSAGIETGTQQLANIGSRLAALRSGSKGIDIGALAVNLGGESLSGNQLATLAAMGLSGGGASADSTFGNWGFFLNGAVNLGDRDTTENETGFDYNMIGITVGADYRFSDRFVAGGAFGYAKNDVDFDSNDGGLDTETWHLAAYATHSLTDRLYLDAIVEYGWNDYESKRNLSYQITPGLDPVSRQASADYDGNQLGASLGAGYDLNEGPFAYGVYGRVAYLQVEVDDFLEQGAGGLNLTMDGFDATSVTTVLGARLSRVFNTSRAVLVPQARFEWEHEYDNDGDILTARFAADPTGTSFRILTDEPDRDYFRLGLGLSAVFPHGFSTFVNYDTLLDKRDWSDHMIDAGVRWEFY